MRQIGTKNAVLLGSVYKQQLRERVGTKRKPQSEIKQKMGQAPRPDWRPKLLLLLDVENDSPAPGSRSIPEAHG